MQGLLLALAVLAGFAVGHVVGGDSPEPVEGLASARVTAVINDVYADFNRGDMAGFAAHFTKDAVYEDLVEGNAPLTGRDRIAQAMRFLHQQGLHYQPDGAVIQNGRVASLPTSGGTNARGFVDVFEFDANLRIVHWWVHYG